MIYCSTPDCLNPAYSNVPGPPGPNSLPLTLCITCRRAYDLAVCALQPDLSPIEYVAEELKGAADNLQDLLELQVVSDAVADLRPLDVDDTDLRSLANELDEWLDSQSKPPAPAYIG